MAVVPPRQESNDLRMVAQPEVWPLRPMYEHLIGIDPENGKLIPQLATEWSLEPDGTSFRFKLRRGVQFHNGFGEFTAKDVVHTWREISKEDSFHSLAGYWRTTVTDIETVNDYEVVFHLARPDGNFLRTVSEAETGMEMRSKAQYDAQGAPTMDGQPYAGTGPYQFKERAQGSYIRFARVPYQHWRVTPDFPEFEFRFQKEASTRLASLLAGEVQITNLPEDLLADANRRGFSTVRGKVAGLRAFLSTYCCPLQDPKNPSLGWMYPDSPLMNLTVRKALDKAINRDEINKAFFAGKGEPMYVNHLHPTRLGWNPEWQQRFPDEYGYDPAKARALLAEAGYGQSTPLSTTMLVNPIPEYSGAEDIAESVAGYWRALGVNVELQQIDPGEIRNRARQLRFNNHFEVRGSSSGQFIGITGYHWSFGPRGGGFEDPAINALMDLISNTIDEQKQDEYWRQMGQILFDGHLEVPLYWLPAEAVMNPSVVADYVFPGSVTGTWTNVQNIKAAR
ncbi:MAG TPA: ABC transporter substrate-binding protein [Chloroflexota bacterium]|jgi:ABC-type transport system substrate-binding protein|nr:ABC transporter substrate-binding protein [Chloroflexota bacterium]